MRKFSHHKKWTSDEASIVQSLFSASSWEIIREHLPGRTKSQIQNKANCMGLVRIKKPKMTLDQIREYKRLRAASKRAKDPAASNAYGMSIHYRNHEKSCQSLRDYYYRRFFWSRAMKLRGENRATFKELAAIWKSQKGLCAMTGRPMTREAHLDHIVAKAKGGDDRQSNLRWVCREVNLARRALSDEDFIQLCKDVMSWIGQRIQMCDEVMRELQK